MAKRTKKTKATTTDAAGRLAAGIAAAVRSAQSKVDLDELVGRHVRRNGTVYLLVSVSKKHVELSNLETEVKQTTRMTRRAFVSKAIEPLGD